MEYIWVYINICGYTYIYIWVCIYIYMDVNDSYMDFWGADHSIGVTY